MISRSALVRIRTDIKLKLNRLVSQIRIDTRANMHVSLFKLLFGRFFT